MCEQTSTDERSTDNCTLVIVPHDVADRLQLAADGSDLTQEEIAQKYLQYGMKNHENAVYGDN